MAHNPILILQMQRMGDLILTFPLMAWLGGMKPGHPIWVVGEESFFETVLKLGPPAVYFPYSAADRLAENPFHMVINLSHRPESAALAGRLKADEYIGPVQKDGIMRSYGAWQLYRASIVHNNRHNRFHWADLNALDVIPRQRLARTSWPPVEHPTTENGSSTGRIGLFLGASEADKHPDATFWAELAALLLRHGLKPVLLGGTAEAELGKKTAARLRAPALNLCGQFSLPELGNFLKTLDLFVTPDTGPMHLAAWLGVPTLNLSLGPVNAWETAPAPPGHVVMRSSVGCTGCWRCTRSQLYCRASFSPKRVALTIQTLLRDKTNKNSSPGLSKPDLSKSALSGLTLPGLELAVTTRGSDGLFSLTSLSPHKTAQQNIRAALGEFWKGYFTWHNGLGKIETVQAAWQQLCRHSPGLQRRFPTALARLAAALSAHIRAQGRAAVPLPPDFWRRHPPFLRPLTGYIPLLLENQDFAPTAWAQALAQIAALADIVAKE